MEEGIRILIERMDSNPEEFLGDLSYRWGHVMQDIGKHGNEYLDEEDMLALNRKIKEIRRKELTAKVVEELATGKRLDRAQEEVRMKESAAQRAAHNTPQSGSTLTASWLDDVLDATKAERIKKQNAMLEQSQAYKKRNNQPWP